MVPTYDFTNSKRPNAVKDSSGNVRLQFVRSENSREKNFLWFIGTQ